LDTMIPEIYTVFFFLKTFSNIDNKILKKK
jgi:hypothetical protein